MKLIGIRIDQNNTDDAIKKNLKQEWYPFLQDYSLEKEELLDRDGTSITNQILLKKIRDKNIEREIFEESLYTNNKKTPRISVHAIVGKNGSGKSTVLEIFFRLVNNFTYKTLKDDGENFRGILYANNISAALFYSIDNTFYCLNSEWRGNEPNNIGIEFVKNNKADVLRIEDEAKLEKHRELLRSFFYTIVVNYSHYSLNTREIYKLTDTLLDPIKDYYDRPLFYKISNKEDHYEKAMTTYYKHWLNGLFHKNDGYTTPITLNPMRTEGNFDVNRERELSAQRLFGLLILNPNFLDEYEAKEVMVSFTFKKIKQKIENQSISWGTEAYLNILLDIYNRWFDKLNLEKYNLKNMSEIGNDQFCKINSITSLNHLFDKELSKYTDRIQQLQATLLYIAYKTISISSKYVDFDYDLSTDVDYLIKKICDEPSHITLKIQQACNHIEKRLLNVDYSPASYSNEIKKEIGDDFKILLDKDKLDSKSLAVDEVFKILYPSVYETDMLLTKQEQEKPVKLSEMSSGERQMLYSLSAVLYHLTNLQSVVEDTHRIKYNHINVLLDEVEMYYHPEYQRQFVHKLLALINGLKLDKNIIQSINICIITHSPFLLSDILKKNILFLSEGEVANNRVKSETFGANVYDILKNGFFLDENALGCFVNEKIKQVIRFTCMQDKIKPDDSLKGIKDISLEEAKIITNFIGDPFLKGYLLNRLGE